MEEEPISAEEISDGEYTSDIAETKDELVASTNSESVDFEKESADKEEFSLETIMDMGVPTQPHTTPVNEIIGSVPPKTQPVIPEISEFEENVMEITSSIQEKTETDTMDFGGSLHDTIEFGINPENERVTKKQDQQIEDVAQISETDTDAVVGDDTDEIMFEVDSSTQDNEQNGTKPKKDDSDMSITGDDVVDKIDEFFRF